MRCELRTPEKLLFTGDAEMVVARSPRGEFGVMDGHAPLVAALVPGLVRIKTASGERRFVVSTGLVQVETDGVTILARDAVAREEITPARLREGKAAGPEEEAFLRAQERAVADA